jgi:CspA family cold shock protein
MGGLGSGSCHLRASLPRISRNPEIFSPPKTPEEAAMATGTVKFWDEHRAFGFIVPEEGGPDVFVHFTALERAGIYVLVKGQRVQFEITSRPSRRDKTMAEKLVVLP